MSARAQARRLRSAGSELARLGPRPLLIARYVTHQVVHRAQLRRLRSTYAKRVTGSGVPGGVLRPPRIDLPPLEQLEPPLRATAERVRAEADDVRAHTIDLLGSGPVALGAQIDWHQDFKSGYRWPALPYWSLQVTRLDDDSDAKVAWDLSRGHQLLTLARGACIYRDGAYADELEAQLASWLDANPPGVGINWANAMEVGLRAVNWLWAIGTLETWRPLERALRERVTAALEAHARHIAANLEGTPFLRSNHYLADVLGLLAIGASIDGPAARRWFDFGRAQLVREIERQVHDDGVCFEASLPYHGLTMEMYLIGAQLAASAGAPMPTAFCERLGRMLDVSAAVRHGDGRIPAFGDGDGGRVLPGGCARPATHDHLLWLGAVLLDRARPLPGQPDPEVAWTLGAPAWRRAATLAGPAPAPPAAFPAGGIYVLDGGGAHAVVRCGGVGQNGNGGHAHNDLMSFELSYRGMPLVVDSGTYSYTADPAARNEMRAAAAHNGVVVDGLDPNPIDPRWLFRLRQLANPAVIEWRKDAGGARLVAEHDGYRRLERPLTHRRTLALDAARGSLSVSDELLGSGRHQARAPLHLAPGTTVARSGERSFELERGGERARIDFWPESLAVEVEEGWFAPTYGVRERAPVLVARLDAEAPVSFGYTIAAAAGAGAAPEPASLAEASS